MPKKLLKVVLIGGEKVGKTSILKQFVEKKFSETYKPTIGADFLSKDINGGVTLQLWDTAGQERFSSLGVAFYRGADVGVAVLDLENLENSSERAADNIEEFVKQSGQETPKLIVVGNKADLDMESESGCVEKAMDFVDQLEAKYSVTVPFLSVSAKADIQISTLFDKVVEVSAAAGDNSSNDGSELLVATKKKKPTKKPAEKKHVDPSSLGVKTRDFNPEEIREQIDADYEKNPALTRLGAESATRRDRLASRPRVQTAFPAGTKARSAAGMASLRTKLNALHSAERQGSSKTAVLRSVMESARAETEPFQPKTTIAVAVTPSSKATFETRSFPITKKCEIPWNNRPNSKYDKEPLRGLMQVVAPVRDGATAEEIQNFETELNKVMTLFTKINKEDSDVKMKVLLEDSAKHPGRKQISLNLFAYEEDVDVVSGLVEELGEGLFGGDINPLRSNLESFLKHISWKAEFGEDLTETMVSRDSAVKPLGHMRVTAESELSTELVERFLPGTMMSAINLSKGGYRARKAEKMLRGGLATCAPLFALKDLTQHLTLESPEHLGYNIIRQLGYITRTTREFMPGTTFTEEKAANMVGRCLPFLAPTGLNLWNFFHAMTLGLQLEGEDSLGLSSLLFASGVIAGPIETIRLDGRATSAVVTIDGFDPAKNAFANVEEQVKYMRALYDSKRCKPKDPAPHLLSISEFDSDDEDDAGSDGSDYSDDSDLDSDASEEERMGYEISTRAKNACRAYNLPKKLTEEEEAFGCFGFEYPYLGRTHPETQQITTYLQRTGRRHCAVTVAVLLHPDAPAPKKATIPLLRLWSDENRLDTEILGEDFQESDGFLARFTHPGSGKIINFVASAFEDARLDGLYPYTCDAVVTIGAAGLTGGGSDDEDGSRGEYPLSKFKKSSIPKKLQFDFLKKDPCALFHLDWENDAAEGDIDQSIYKQTWNGLNSSDFGGIKDKLLEVREEIVNSALATHSANGGSSGQPSNGFDYAYTQLPLLGRAVVKSAKAKQDAASEAMQLLAGGSSSDWSDDSDE